MPCGCGGHGCDGMFQAATYATLKSCFSGEHLMEGTCGINNPVTFPPNHGLSLGWRLALSTVLIISLVMGGFSVTQQVFELRKDRDVQRKLLVLSLAPLAVRLEKSATMDWLFWFQNGYAELVEDALIHPSFLSANSRWFLVFH